MDKQVSNIAAIFNVNRDLRIIQDEFDEVAMNYSNVFTAEQLESDLSRLADCSTESEEKTLRNILQLLAAQEQNREDFMKMKYNNCSILFTFTIVDNHITQTRNTLIDMKSFRNHFDMLRFLSAESSRLFYENAVK